VPSLISTLVSYHWYLRSLDWRLVRSHMLSDTFPGLDLTILCFYNRNSISASIYSCSWDTGPAACWERPGNLGSVPSREMSPVPTVPRPTDSSRLCNWYRRVKLVLTPSNAEAKNIRNCVSTPPNVFIERSGAYEGQFFRPRHRLGFIRFRRPCVIKNPENNIKIISF
jgi:hypothetical protein